MRKEQLIGAYVAQEMQDLLIKSASKDACCSCEKCDKDCKCQKCAEDCASCMTSMAGTSEIMTALLKVSEQLDERGLSKSAVKVMEALNIIMSEAFDQMDVSDKLYGELKDLVQKYPEFKRPAKSLVVESPLGDLVESEGADEISLMPTEHDLTEAPPSHMAEELPIIPEPTSTNNFLKDLETEKMKDEIEDLLYEPKGNENPTVHPLKIEIAKAMSQLDNWLKNAADPSRIGLDVGSEYLSHSQEDLLSHENDPNEPAGTNIYTDPDFPEYAQENSSGHSMERADIDPDALSYEEVYSDELDNLKQKFNKEVNDRDNYEQVLEDLYSNFSHLDDPNAYSQGLEDLELRDLHRGFSKKQFNADDEDFEDEKDD